MQALATYSNTQAGVSENRQFKKLIPKYIANVLDATENELYKEAGFNMDAPNTSISSIWCIETER